MDLCREEDRYAINRCNEIGGIDILELFLGEEGWFILGISVAFSLASSDYYRSLVLESSFRELAELTAISRLPSYFSGQPFFAE